MYRRFFYKDIAMGLRSVSLRINCSTHHPSLVYQPSRSSWWRMTLEFLLSMSGAYQKSTKMRSVSTLLKQYCHQMKRQNLLQYSPHWRRKNTKSPSRSLHAISSIKSRVQLDSSNQDQASPWRKRTSQDSKRSQATNQSRLLVLAVTDLSKLALLNLTLALSQSDSQRPCQ